MTNMEFDMREHRNLMAQPGEWVFAAPIDNVVLTEAVNREFHIGRVAFVSSERLPYIRRRLGIPERISEMNKQTKKFFSSAKTFAVVRHTDEPEQAKRHCRRLVQDALSMLAASQLGYKKRRFGSCPAIKGQTLSSSQEYFIIDSDDARLTLGSQLFGKPDELILNDMWKEFHESAFFLELVKIINHKIEIANSWKEDLKRAAILVGQSQCSSDLPHAFLWNMIVLELLVTHQSNQLYEKLPSRIEAFLGWVGFWETENYSDRIKEIYKKRNLFVHQGKSDSVEIKDLLFADDIILNLLINLVKHHQLFQTKEDVVEFSRKVEAERILGVAPKVRPKTFQYFSRRYSDEDYSRI